MCVLQGERLEITVLKFVERK